MKQVAKQDSIDWVDLVGAEWAEWYSLTPAERLEESSRLWQTYLEPDAGRFA